AVGLALMVWTPITLMPEHRETTAPLWRQLAGGSYLWWALAVIVAIGTVTVRAAGQKPTDVDAAVPTAKVVKA
ncbi:alpha-(1-2)-phosphatidylinositol mannosyltransferase, partial [Mycobacterium sp. ITM-2017-0098]